MTALSFGAGLLLLIGGAEALVRGGSALAARVGVSPLVVGLTVVAFGTSAPELSVSVAAGLRGDADLVLGNVVGSNVFNVLGVLGVAALIAPLVVSREVVRRQVPVMIGVSLLVVLLASDGTVGRGDGVLLLGGIVVYTAVLLREGRRRGRSAGPEVERAVPGSDSLARSEPDEAAGAGPDPEAGAGPKPAGEPGPAAERPRRIRGILIDLAMIGLGLTFLVLGSGWLVEAARTVALGLGVSELVVGLTVVAVGTSLPELATSVVAVWKGEREVAVGNVVGSNVFNLLAILGTGAVLAPGGIDVAPAALTFDLPVMVAVAIACLPVFVTGSRISRWEGGLFLGFYLGYLAYLVLDTTGHDALPEFRAAMIFFILPLILLTGVVLVLRARRS